MFHPRQSFNTLTKEEATAGSIKTFTGNGMAELPVPGIKGPRNSKGEIVPYKIRVGSVDIAPIRNVAMRDFRLTDDKLPPINTTMSMYQVVELESGPILMRSTTSNDGIWQKGVSIVVWAEWEGQESVKPSLDAAPPISTPNAETPYEIASRMAHGLVSRESKEILYQKALGLHIAADETWTAEQLAAAICASAGHFSTTEDLLANLERYSIDELRNRAKPFGVNGTAKREIALGIAKAQGYPV